jgi:hypothetical protein
LFDPKLAAQGEEDFRPIRPDGKLEVRRRADEGEGEKQRSCQLGHRIIPLFYPQLNEADLDWFH